jgi:hypothetical protein
MKMETCIFLPIYRRKNVQNAQKYYECYQRARICYECYIECQRTLEVSYRKPGNITNIAYNINSDMDHALKYRAVAFYARMRS